MVETCALGVKWLPPKQKAPIHSLTLDKGRAAWTLGVYYRRLCWVKFYEGVNEPAPEAR